MALYGTVPPFWDPGNNILAMEAIETTEIDDLPYLPEKNIVIYLWFIYGSCSKPPTGVIYVGSSHHKMSHTCHIHIYILTEIIIEYS